MTNPILNEGLRPNDLARMIYPIFEVDAYCSKMGEDRDVCVVSFQVVDRAPAKDIMEFIEKGYAFVLDSDISSGENENGEYTVFVELPRSEELVEHITELAYGVNRLTGLEKFQFKYHKTPTIHDLTTESLNEVVPTTPMLYDNAMHTVKTESIKRFFNKTLMDDLTLENDVITIHKHFGQQIKLKIVSEDASDLLEDTSALTMTDAAMAEIFWFSKVLGDYNINMVGENLIFNNNNKSMMFHKVN